MFLKKLLYNIHNINNSINIKLNNIIIFKYKINTFFIDILFYTKLPEPFFFFVFSLPYEIRSGNSEKLIKLDQIKI